MTTNVKERVTFLLSQLSPGVKPKQSLSAKLKKLENQIQEVCLFITVTFTLKHNSKSITRFRANLGNCVFRNHQT